ncbi:muscular LMNA-interacting protein isoform X5 [Danio rerio]|uniref:Muscular LMNA-interacting protein isoform X5 n=1 Tax=Danio rerio TaxID=7955 RepID=A0AC58H3P0_DANRE
MALEQPHRTLGKVTTVFATKLKSFPFVPFLKRLPAENRVWRKVFQTNRAKSSGEPGDCEKSMAEGGVYKAEVVFVQDAEDGQIGEMRKNTTQNEIQSTDNLMLKPPTTLTGSPTELTAVSPEPGPAVIETTDNKQPSVSQLGFHNISEAAEVSSGPFLNSSSQRQEALSPASSVDFFNSPMSSKESILSEGWDKERSWSGFYMFSRDGSRTVSPCSSIRSGTFTPSVTYKIKSTYKALAAIPTNTLLLEQQAIDEEVSKKEALLNPADNYSWEDLHAEMCSPAQLRQQTAELYATIDEVLEDTIQTRQSNHVNKAMLKSLAAEASRQTSSPSPKLLGRETRYASSPFQPSVTTEKTMTKPGVIRPVIITSRFTEDQDEEFHPNPFKILHGNKSNRYQYKFVSGGLCAEAPADAPADSDPQPSERQEDYKSRLASTQDVPSAVSTHETHT